MKNIIRQFYHSFMPILTTKFVSVPQASNNSTRPPNVKLPDSLESLSRADHFPTQRHRWNTNEEIATILISFDKHTEWLSKEVKIRPKSGSMLLYSRKKVRYRRDNYCWKKRKDGKTTREDHMKLKVQGVECIYGCYVHSAILPTFHRRCYWLLQNSDIVMVHYLNVPSSEGNQILIPPCLSYCPDRKEWTKEDLISQLKPMFYSENEPNMNNEYEISTAETIQRIVEQLIDKQRNKNASVTSTTAVSAVKVAVTSDYNNKKASNKQQNGLSNNIVQKKSVQTTTTNQIISSPKVSASPSKTSSVNEMRCLATLGSTQSTISSATVSSANVLLATATCSSILSQGTTSATTGSTPNTGPLILNLAQLQAGRSVLILNNNPSGGNESSITPASVSVVYNQDMVSSTQDNIETINQNVTVECETTENITRIQSDQFSNKCNDENSSNINSSALMAETLDLSNEDIQQTLSANLPAPSSTCSVPISPYSVSKSVCDTNISRYPMDFIDTDITTPSVDEVEDVLVNLDTFDMLADFPEFENLFNESSSHDEHKYITSSATSANTTVTDVKPNVKPSMSENHSFNANSRMDYREGTANITDYSPEWSYTEVTQQTRDMNLSLECVNHVIDLDRGGVKVLVTGPWYSSTSLYNVRFDGVNVPTSLVQTGVLRCLCPAHEEGLVHVQVVCEGHVISNAVIFEYKIRPQILKKLSVNQQSWHCIDDNLLRVSLMERLDQIEKRLCVEPITVKTITANERKAENINSKKRFEGHFVNYCKSIMGEKIFQNSPQRQSLINDLNSKIMTVLHVASALGYSELVSCLLKWRTTHYHCSNFASEFDPLSRDENDATPFLWACARGHLETAVRLYQHNHSVIQIPDKYGNTPLSIAKSRGYMDIVNFLQDIIKSNCAQNEYPDQLTREEGRKFSLDLPLKVTTSDFNCDDLNFSSVSPMFSSDCSSPRPTLSKLSSVDSGINLSSNNDSLFVGKHLSGEQERSLSHHQSRLDRSMSLPISPNVPLFSSMNQSSSNIMSFDINEEMSSLPVTFMDVDNTNTVGSPFIDVVGISDEENDSKQSDNRKSISIDSDSKSNACVLTLAEQIIAALPERIKATANNHCNNDNDDDICGRNNIHSEKTMHTMKDFCSTDDGCSLDTDELTFPYSSNSYRYTDLSTPTSSLSPASSTCIPSPGSLNLNSPSPPPTTADFCEFFQASGIVMEKHFSNLTLSDKEQRELYEAAKTIQKAYRNYKGRKLQEEQEKEQAAAVLIQSSYRRYKQYVYFKQMTKAAVLIQNHYRSYCENKSFKKSLEGGRVAASSTPGSIQQHPYSRMYKEVDGNRMRAPNTRETTPTPTTAGVKRTYSQRRQHQAARKIQQFMRQSKNNYAQGVRDQKSFITHFDYTIFSKSKLI
ncbi:Calmodulin-binding transcription activator 2 [Nymphon striatum]|nr:Calmodulin-binding transcription activator 2 [Nymphon striatum]